ncbi:MAG: RNA-binding protein [Rickettsiales bacterium]|jgi:signal recognition particle subunit SRP54|nr:RNA-binding protein [Rickettsiales bacterium]
MFDNLANSLGNVFSKLKKQGIIREEDVDMAMREVRIALLEADVALPVAKEFIAKVRERAVGQEVVRSVSPAQMVIKIVQDTLTELLGGNEAEGLNLATTPPAVIMMVGLQGSGKTTTSGKIGLFLKQKMHKKVLLASLDTYRPAAQDQLAVVGTQTQVDTLAIIPGQMPPAIAARALQEAKRGGYDVLILDTAGRLHIDEALMQELQEVKKLTSPIETLLVADSLTGQDAVNVASEFNGKVGVTGIVLTRIDGDGRGGAALSMRHVTGCPIKFLGSGEKLEALEPFHPGRIASRILDMGDVVSLVERAVENIDQEEAARLTQRVKKGQFDFNDLASQFKQMRKMGGIGGIMGMLPGIGAMKKQIEDANVDETILKRQEAIISSMTPKERRDAKLLNASRKRRIAAGSGTSVQEVNRLIKQYMQMSTMMKKFGKMDKKSMMRSGLGKLMGAGNPFGR